MKENETNSCPCNSCHAPEFVKDSFACNRSRLVNAAETCKRDFFAIFGSKYEPDYRCDAEIYFEFDESWRRNDERAD